MKRLIRKSGLGQRVLDRIPGDTVTVYHGTSFVNYDSIMQSGITHGGGKSYQNVIDGLWVSLEEGFAQGHARKSVEGMAKDGEENQWGVIFCFTMNKADLTDEGSNNNKAFMSKVPITPDMLQSGSAYKFNIKTGEQESI